MAKQRSDPARLRCGNDACLVAVGKRKAPATDLAVMSFAVTETVVTLDDINAMRYVFIMIIAFKCKDTQKLASGRRVRRFVNFERVALRKLRQLQAANVLDDLKIPPGNMLESLSGDRKGQHSIRINKQFRVCFRWTTAGAEDVEIVDYH